MLSPSLLPSVYPRIRVFSNESALCIRWPNCWSFSINPFNEYLGRISSRIDWFDLLVIQGSFVRKWMSLLFNMLSGFVIVFLLGSKCFLISWLQSPSVILQPKKIKFVTVSIISPCICHEVTRLDDWSLNLWVKSDLIIVYDLFNVLLNFAKDFCIYDHQWYRFVILFFLCDILIWFWYQGWWWPQRMGLEVFLPLQIFGRVWEDRH